MIALTLQIAAFPVISRAVASRLAGNWIAIFMCRRQCSCVLSEVFGLGSRSTTGANFLQASSGSSLSLTFQCPMPTESMRRMPP